MDKLSNIYQQGQALVTLLFFMVIAISVTSAAIVVVFINSQSTTKLEQGTLAYYVAESGAENGFLRLLRDPTYTGETLAVGNNNALIQVTGIGPYTITSMATVSGFVRKIQATLSYTNNVATISAWKEVP